MLVDKTNFGLALNSPQTFIGLMNHLVIARPANVGW